MKSLSPSQAAIIRKVYKQSAFQLASGSRLESPRTPVQLSTKFKSIALSPLVDHRSQLSLPETDHNRLRWLNRFTPRWNESKEERLNRFKQRSLIMKTRRAHSERLLNSFQRLDAFTGTVLPSDFMISFNFSKWQPPIENSQPVQSVKNKKNQMDGPGIYLTPNRILHPYWVPKKKSMSIWLFCHQDILKNKKKLRTLYRYTQEPKFSPYLSDQICSQLIRRVAQECVVLKRALGSAPSSAKTTLDPIIVDKAQSEVRHIISDYPILSGNQSLIEYVKNLLDQPQVLDQVDQIAKSEEAPWNSASLGAIIVLSSKLFQQLLELDSKSSKSKINTTQDTLMNSDNRDNLMFSLSLLDGPVPVWDLEKLLQIMAKHPPRKSSDHLITAEINQATKILTDFNLAKVLMKQIKEGLNYSNQESSSSKLKDEKDQAYLIPLTELSYPLILSLRRATWWLGQGFELQHFSHIKTMVMEANHRKNQKELDWLNWLRNKNSVVGRIHKNGQLYVPIKNPIKNTTNLNWKRV